MCRPDAAPETGPGPQNLPSNLQFIFMKVYDIFSSTFQNPQWLTAYHPIKIKQLTQHGVVALLFLTTIVAERPYRFPRRTGKLSGKGLDNGNPLDYFLCLSEN
jgi:hypothetical protein